MTSKQRWLGGRFGGVLILALALHAAPQQLRAQAGVVVTRVVDGTPEDVAGLVAGDVLLSWTRAADGAARTGPLTDPFDLIHVAIEEFPRGAFRFAIDRDGERFDLELPFGELEYLRVRPRLAATAEHEFRTARELWEGGDEAGALEIWRSMAQADTAAERAVWWHFFLGERNRSAGEYESSQEHFEAAIELTPDDDVATLAIVHRAFGELLLLPLNRTDAAEEHFERALTLRRDGGVGALTVGDALDWRSEPHRFREDYRQALEVVEQWLELARREVPQGIQHARAMDAAGYLNWRLGDFVTAGSLYRQVREIVPRSTPIDHSMALFVPALIARARGDLATHRELTLEFVDLGLARPEPAQRALALAYRASLEEDDGALEQAAATRREALALRREAFDDKSFPVASSLGRYGLLERMRGRLDEAQRLYEEALEIFREISPAGRSEGEILIDIGDLAADRGDDTAALEAYQRSAQIRAAIQPGTEGEATAHHRVARALHRTGRLTEAEVSYRRAIVALESQTRKLGGSDQARAGFWARHGHFYRDLIGLLIERVQHDEAFLMVERSRARQLLELLRQRDLDWGDRVSPELDAQWRSLEKRSSATLGRLARLSADDAETIAPLQAELEQIGAERRRLRDQMRSAAPALAAIQFPAPLSVGEVQAKLSTGDVLLSYSVGREESFAFAVTREGLRVEQITAGEAALRDQVSRLVDAYSRQRPLSAIRRERAERQLSDQLLEPFADWLRQAEKIVVLPDGPLHLLPFAALPLGESGEPLLVQAPLRFAPSATALDQFRDSEQQRDARLVAFGAPRYPVETGSTASPQLQDVLRSGFDLAPLPASLGEVEEIGSLFGDLATIWTGVEATEGRAKAVDREVPYLHFAAHARLDERFPLESALVLSIPDGDEQENGLLQVWEIFDEVRLDADLVTLSACETAGADASGEGLLGLTRAFQFAGARAVAASLWRVGDDSTAALMADFYRGVREGVDVDEALRQAQLRFLERPQRIPGSDVRRDVSEPFHWAAFQVYGGGFP